MEHRLTEPFNKDKLKELRAGDKVLITGTVYTARDAAHKRITEMIASGQEPPFPIAGSIIYYVGPTPAKEGMPIGSAGPTTSYRMDAYAPELLYMAAIGGAAALMAKCIRSAQVIAFEDLGAEAVRKLYVEDFPVTVVLDAYGGDLYARGRENYLKSLVK